MKKHINHLMLLAAMPFACFCTKEISSSQSGELVTISASIPDTKVSFTPGSDPALSLAWENTDQVVVKGTEESVFSLSEIIDSHKATFQGTAVSGSSFSVYYPSSSILSRSYEGQVQDGNASTSHLVYNAMAEGLSSYDDFTFTKVNGAIKLVVKVPASVTAVSSISVTSLTSENVEQNVFFKTNNAEGEKTATLSLGFTEGTAPADGVLTAYAMVSWNDVDLAAESRLAIMLTVPDRSCSYQKTIKVSSSTTISGGETFIIDLSDASELKHVLAGSGTESDPYLLYDAEDLGEIRPIIEKNAGVYQYFKLMDDIDMGSITNWQVINDGNVKAGSTTYAGRIHFDGNNKTLSNLKSTNRAFTSFFGVLVGSVKDLNFDNATISANSSACGVIGGYIGQGANLGEVSNVTITNSSVNYKNTAGGAVAGIAAGTLATAEISGVTVSKSELIYSATTATYAGLLFGSRNSTYTSKISDCHSIDNTATLSTTTSGFGGIIGDFLNGSIEKCSVEGDITSSGNVVGGIVGYLEGGEVKECWYSGDMIVKDNSGGIGGTVKGSIINCYTKGTITNSASQKSGGIGGECYQNIEFKNCYSTMAISGGGRVFGGIAGRFHNNKWNGSEATNHNMYATNCISAGSINSTCTNTAFGSSGAVFGNANATIAHYTNCWRKYNFSFNCAYSAGATVVDQGYTVTSYTVGTYGAGVGGSVNWWPYHASEASVSNLKAAYSRWSTTKADNEITVSDIAKAIRTDDSTAWDTTIWDLSGDCPTLKGNPEK